MNKKYKRFTVALPIDPEDAQRMLADPNVAYNKKLLAERERRFAANILAALNNQPAPYPLPEGIFDDATCPECGHSLDD